MTVTKLLKRKAFLMFVFLFIAIGTFVSTASAQQGPPNVTDPKNAKPDKDGVYGIVEVPPSFPGGMSECNMFLAKNIKYPAEDRANNTQGRVILQFVVELDGSLTNIRSVRAPTKAMADEAIRLLSTSPKWIPGMQNGQKVRASFTNVVSFTL